MQPRTSRGWKFSVILTTCLILALVCVAYPIYVIRPFRAQGARELAVALVVSRFRPVFSAVLALVAIWAAVGYWRENARIWRRIVMTSGAVFACVLAVLARVNVYELMFHPIDRVEPQLASLASVEQPVPKRLVLHGVPAVGRPAALALWPLDQTDAAVRLDDGDAAFDDRLVLR